MREGRLTSPNPRPGFPTGPRSPQPTVNRPPDIRGVGGVWLNSTGDHRVECATGIHPKSETRVRFPPAHGVGRRLVVRTPKKVLVHPLSTQNSGRMLAGLHYLGVKRVSLTLVDPFCPHVAARITTIPKSGVNVLGPNVGGTTLTCNQKCLVASCRSIAGEALRWGAGLWIQVTQGSTPCASTSRMLEGITSRPKLRSSLVVRAPEVIGRRGFESHLKRSLHFLSADFVPVAQLDRAAVS